MRGYQNSEASNGRGDSSPTNVPLVQVRRLDNNQLAWLSPASFSSTIYSSQPVTGVLAGPAMLTVFVNGVPSQAQLTTIDTQVPLQSLYLPVAFE